MFRREQPLNHSAVVAKLPHGATPLKTLYFGTIGHPYQLAKIRLDPDGNIVLEAGGEIQSPASDVSLSGIYFFTD